MRTQHFEMARTVSAPALAQLRERAAEAIAAGARTLVLSGDGARESVQALAVTASDGVELVLLVDEGRPLSPTEVPSLVAAGVRTLVVQVLRLDPAPALALARAAHAAGLRVVARLPLEERAPTAQARLGFLRRAAPELSHFELAPRAATAAIADDVARTEADARRAKVELSIADDHPLPPCLVELPSRARTLLAPRMRHEVEDAEPCRAHEACARCALRGVCTITSSELARLTTADRTPQPIADLASYARPGKNAGKRLRVLGAADVEQFFHVDYDYASVSDTSAPSEMRPTSRIGLVYRCNQTCTFCELADMDVDLAPEVVRRALDAARARGSIRVILTGGEPTLCRDLVDHVAYARTVGFEEIELQTNAVLLDRPGAAAALHAAGLTSAQISLHGPDAAISDRLTAAPGTHARTLRGVDALLEAGVRVLLNHLVFVDNASLLLEFVDMVHARWGAHCDRLVIQFHSPRNEFATREEGLRHVPRYATYAARLVAAIDRARSLGLNVRDLQDPTGIPSLCVLGADTEYLGRVTAQRTSPRFHRWESEWLTRVPACTSCARKDECMGIPKHYLALHGDSEFRAFTAPVDPAPAMERS